MKNNHFSTFGIAVISGLAFLMLTSCSKSHKVGGKGPGGGVIFHDKGSESDGWRYLEAALEDQSENAKFGCSGTSIEGAQNTAVGTGKANTDAILAACKDPDIATKIAASYSGGGKSDWYLPSREELVLMFKNLHENGKGNFDEIGYHSSSEKGDGEYWYVLFINGSSSAGKKDYVGGKVRAIRSF